MASIPPTPGCIATDLPQALARDQLRLHYEPRVDLADGRTRGAEALLRWAHPTLGLLDAERFVPLAEQTGLIGDIGAWTLRTATREAAGWQSSGGAAPPVVAVGVSARQLFARRLLADVTAALRASSLPPARLELELRDPRALDGPDDIAVLQALRDMGVGIALDGFGTGWASLAALKRLPLTAIRLDRHFVHDLPGTRDLAIARATGALASAFGLSMVAAGVETEQQRDVLRDLGFATAQGFLFGRPEPPELARRAFA